MIYIVVKGTCYTASRAALKTALIIFFLVNISSN